MREVGGGSEVDVKNGREILIWAGTGRAAVLGVREVRHSVHPLTFS